MSQSKYQGGYHRNTRGSPSNYRYQQHHHDDRHHRHHDHHHHHNHDVSSKFALPATKDRYSTPINLSGSQGNFSQDDAVRNNWAHGEGSSGTEPSLDVERHQYRLKSTELTKDSPCSSAVSQQCHLDSILVGDILVDLKRHHQDGTSMVDSSVTMDYGFHITSPIGEKISHEDVIRNSSRDNKGTAEAVRSSNIIRHEHRQQSTDGTASLLQGTFSLENAVGDSLRHIMGSAETEGPSNIERHQQRQQTDWTASSSPKSSDPLPVADSPYQMKELALPSSSDTNKYQTSKIKRPRQGKTWSEILFDQESSEHPRSLPLVSSNLSHDRSLLPVHAGQKDILSNTGPQYGKKLPKRERTTGYLSKLSEMSSTAMKFDICVTKRGAPVKPKPPQRLLLRPGMVLLKNYISQPRQIKIVKVCRDLGLGDGGFYQPGFGDGRNMHLQMMCLGKNWDPITKLYEDRRPIDGAVPPSIPDDFKKLVEGAIQSSHSFIKEEVKECKPELILPGMQPDICIINFYSTSGKLGLHQDKDESKQSLKNGLPVVSFSIGDSADFIYADHRVVENPDKVRLDSGDVLIFGGASRNIFHGVPTIIPDSAPSYLSDDANLRPGRLNLTFRQY